MNDTPKPEALANFAQFAARFGYKINTKSDKETQAVVNRNVKSFLEAMKKTWQFLPRHFVTSAIKKTGKEKILTFIEDTNSGQ